MAGFEPEGGRLLDAAAYAKLIGLDLGLGFCPPQQELSCADGRPAPDNPQRHH
jgi:hypothetical protein